MNAGYTVQCLHPEHQKIGCWVFTGDDHTAPGTTLSPLFTNLQGLFQWMNDNDWSIFGTLRCRKNN